MTDWEEVHLSDFVHIKHGFAFKGEYFCDEPTDNYLVTPGNFFIGGGFKQDKFKYYAGPIQGEYVLAPGDLVVTMTDLSKQADTLGFSALVPEIPGKTLLHNQRIGLVEFQKDGLDRVFTYFLLRTSSYRHHVVSSASGSTVKHTSPTKITSFRFKKPPISTQIEIGENLIELEKKIILNGETNQTLEQIAQAIFKSWFVNFEPVKAKQSMRALGGNDEQTERAALAVVAGTVNLDVITTATDLRVLDQQLAAGLGEKLTHQTDAQREQLATTASHFPDQLMESELGLIPEGWEVSTIGDEVDVVGGGTPSTKNDEFWKDGDINWTSPKDLSGLTDKILAQTARKITAAGLGKISSGLLPKNTVLMSSRAPVGYLALAKIPVAINQGYIAMQCNGRLSSEYVMQWANSVMDDIKQRASGTTFAEISKKNFRIIPLAVPSQKAVDEYTNLAAEFYEKIFCTNTESTCLAKTRDTLLPRLLSGQLEVGA